MFRTARTLRPALAALAIATVATAASFVPSTAHAALPPDKITDLLPKATGIVDVTVVSVAELGPVPTTEPHEPGWVGPIPPDQAQLVEVKTVKVLRWTGAGVKPKVGETFWAVKPLQPYSVKPGTSQTVLLDACSRLPVMLGLYGTAFYKPEEIAAAMKTVKALPCAKK